MCVSYNYVNHGIKKDVLWRMRGKTIRLPVHVTVSVQYLTGISGIQLNIEYTAVLAPNS